MHFMPQVWYVCRLLLYISNSVEMATSDARGKQTSVYIHTSAHVHSGGGLEFS